MFILNTLWQKNQFLCPPLFFGEHSVPWTLSRCTLTPRAGSSSFPLYRLSTWLVSVVCVIREGVPLVWLARTPEKMGAVGWRWRVIWRGRVFRGRLKIQEDQVLFYIRVFPPTSKQRYKICSAKNSSKDQRVTRKSGQDQPSSLFHCFRGCNMN